MLAEQAFNGSSPHRKRVDIPGMFLNLILEQKENKARGKKFESAAMRASFAALATFISRYTAGPHVCLSRSRRHRLPGVKILPIKLTFAVAVVVATLYLDAGTSHAGMYGNSRWCAVTDQGSDALNWDCEYETIEDCTPAVLTGNRGFCAINPYWRAAPDQN
jgi:hypothetical protein